MNILHEAMTDFIESLKRWRFWILFGWHDASSTYERTKLGNWIYSINTAIWICCIYFVFRQNFSIGTSTYLLHLGFGYTLYVFLSSCITAGIRVFTASSNILLNIPIPLLSCVLRVVFRNLVQLAYSLVFPVLAYIYYILSGNLEIQATMLLLPVSIFIFIMTGFFLTFISGIFGTYFADLSEITKSIMRLMLFITPVLWVPTGEDGFRTWIALINPFTHLLGLIRIPITGEGDMGTTLFYTGGILLVVIMLSLLIYKYAGRSIVFRL